MQNSTDVGIFLKLSCNYSQKSSLISILKQQFLLKNRKHTEISFQFFQVAPQSRRAKNILTSFAKTLGLNGACRSFISRKMCFFFLWNFKRLVCARKMLDFLQRPTAMQPRYNLHKFGELLIHRIHCFNRLLTRILSPCPNLGTWKHCYLTLNGPWVKNNE